tara:strand:+ start:2348 stop:2830 length:483 start_codon:yes stop_codon:yes gene_type:complete
MAKFTRPDAPPPPLFVGEKERRLVRQVNTELIENVVGQVVAYYPISLTHTDFHPVYGEAIEKTFLPPIRVYARVETLPAVVTNDTKGYDKRPQISVYFHRKRLTEDQDLFVRVGDFVYYDSDYYEIVSTTGSKRLFGQGGQKYEITAQCIKAREGVFDGD